MVCTKQGARGESNAAGRPGARGVDKRRKRLKIGPRCRRKRCLTPCGMKRYGVKLNSGKLMWVHADDVECRDGAVLFLRFIGEHREIIAGFSLGQVNHWGLPEAFAHDEP